MKKKYFAPNTIIMELSTSVILTGGSLPVSVNGKQSNEAALGRGNGFWDDDDDEY